MASAKKTEELHAAVAEVTALLRRYSGVGARDDNDPKTGLPRNPLAFFVPRAVARAIHRLERAADVPEPKWEKTTDEKTIAFYAEMIEGAVRDYRNGNQDAVAMLHRFLSSIMVGENPRDPRKPSRATVRAWLDGWIDPNEEARKKADARRKAGLDTYLDSKPKQGKVPAGRFTTQMILELLGFHGKTAYRARKKRS